MTKEADPNEARPHSAKSDGRKSEEPPKPTDLSSQKETEFPSGIEPPTIIDKAEDKSSILSRLSKSQIAAISFLVLATLSVFAFLISRPAPTTTSADVVTEFVEITLRERETIPNGLPNIAEVIGPGMNVCKTTADIRWNEAPVGATTRISVTANRSDLTAIMRIESAAEAGDLGLVSCGDESVPIGQFLLAKFDIADLSLVGFGSLSIGEVPRNTNTSGITGVVSGRVEVYALSFPMRTGYLLTTRNLMLGDSIRMVANSTGTQSANAAYLVKSEADHTIRVVAHAKAHHVEVKRLGAERGYVLDLAPSPIARILAQSEWVLIAGLVAIGSLLLNWWELRELVRVSRIGSKNRDEGV